MLQTPLLSTTHPTASAQVRLTASRPVGSAVQSPGGELRGGSGTGTAGATLLEVLVSETAEATSKVSGAGRATLIVYGTGGSPHGSSGTESDRSEPSGY